MGAAAKQALKIIFGILIIMSPQNHIFEDPDITIWKQGIPCEGIKIEDEVWIGANAKGYTGYPPYTQFQ